MAVEHYRKIIYLPIKANSMKQSESVDLIHPENVVLEYFNPKTGIIERVDFGKYCFDSRDLPNESRRNPESNVFESRVDPKTFRPERRNLIRALIRFLREQQISASTIYTNARYLITALLTIEKEIGFDDWPTNESTALAWYKFYVMHLFTRTRLPKGTKGTLNPTAAATHAKLLRKVFDYAELASEWTLSSAIQAPKAKKTSNRNEPPSKSERQEFIQVCLTLFEQMAKNILDDKPLPWFLSLKNVGRNETIFWRGANTGNVSIYTHLYYRPDGTYKTLGEFEKTLNELDCVHRSDVLKINGKGKTARDNLLRHFVTYKEHADSKYSDPVLHQVFLRRSYEIATMCFWYCFIAATGVNYSVGRELKVGSEQYRPQRGYVFSGLKARASNKVVYPEFRKIFSPYFEQFKKLRSWAVSQLDIDPQHWFFTFDEIKDADTRSGIRGNHRFRRINKNSYSTMKSGVCLPLKNLLRVNGLTIRPLSPKELRNGLSADFLQLSRGNTELVAKKLGNTPQTVREAYSDMNETDIFPEFAEYYSSVMQRIKANSGAKNDGPHKEVVKLVSDDTPDNIPIGSCENTEFIKPKKSSQFGDFAPDPDCARSETCLFCEYFAMHADHEGLKKILSFKELFPLIKKRVGSMDRYLTVFAPIEARIEEIIEYIASLGGSQKALIDSVREEIEEGELDEFWESHFNLLTDLGYVA